jgi:hypothetical protein
MEEYTKEYIEIVGYEPITADAPANVEGIKTWLGWCEARRIGSSCIVQFTEKKGVMNCRIAREIRDWIGSTGAED